MSTVPIPIQFVKYSPAAAMVLILWDHCLTLGEEVATIWGPRNERILTKAVYLLNRYFTEATLIYRIYVIIQGQSTNDEVGTRSALVVFMIT
ncbi:hypothetical protein EV421DRAFT_293203 [Armillaria borealis]|uniref:DUF6533 domain-containing protein n=1 Tax=Armillaria borealis TaxID=47425 RepID=A0AA39JQU3_9AGAR|nr:hypothetical protein EV421DRAFT_293203 [Armillaria borealis]